ncbi:hypothetical protein [Kurlavirus BKC-1]|nr:hypothetical protein [Kurlavirus BKC-1]
MTSQTNSGDTKEDSLEKLFREIQWDRERDMRMRIQNEQEDRERTRSSVYATSDPRTRKTESGAFERRGFLVLSSLPTSLEPMSSLVHKRNTDAQNNTKDMFDKIRQQTKEGQIIYEDTDPLFVALPEGTHLKFATENFLRMMKDE